MKKISIIICFFFTVFFSFLHGQNSEKVKVSIKGQVLDSADNQTIPFATIRVFKTPNELKPTKALASDDKGNFDFTLTEKGNYILSINFTGKSELKKEITIDGDSKIDLGKLLMGDGKNTLKAVEVSAIRPLIKVDIDKITYSLEEDPESRTNNVLEMMKKVPMITVDAEDKIELKGSTNYKIYLNGKPSEMISKNPKDILKSMPANSIKDIEVITEPGAKYDAEGVVGIINIITQKNSSLGGYTGSVRVGVDHRGGYNTGGYISAKKGKFGVTANLSRYAYKSPSNSSNSFTEYYKKKPLETGQQIVDTTQYQSATSNSNGGNYWGRFEVSYEIDTLNLININGGGYFGDGKSTFSSNVAKRNAANILLSEYNNYGNTKNSYGGLNYGVDYQRTFKTKERLLTSSYRLNQNPESYEKLNNIDSVYLFNTAKNRQSTESKMDEHTFQIDYTSPFAKIHSFEVGVKYIIRLSESDNDHEKWMRDNSWQQVITDNDKFKHRLDIVSAYSGYSLKYKKIGFKAGLRYESTYLKVNYPINTNLNFNTDYSNLVPSVGMTYQVKQMQNIRIGYNMRISRPSIWQLNPYLNTSDTTNIFQGNPDLQSAKSHNISANYSIYKQKFNMNVSLSYSLVNNAAERFTIINNDDIRYTTYKNIGKNRNYNISYYGNWTPSTKWRFNTNISGTYIDVKSIIDNTSTTGFNTRLSGGAQYTMPWKMISNFNFGYSNGFTAYQRKYGGYSYYSASITKSLLKDKLDININGSNFLKKYMTRKNSEETLSYRSIGEFKYENRYIGINISYRFGEMKAQIKKATRTISNDDSMGGGQGGGGNQGGGQGQ